MSELQVSMTDGGPRYFALLAAAAAAVDGLRRVPIAILGKFVKGAQKFAITRQTMTDLVANFRKRPADTVIDYEHASEFPEIAQGQPIPAAGWIKRLDDGPDEHGVLWGEAEFTPRAQGMIEAKEYKYFSPVIAWGARDKHTGEAQGATLVSGALTQRPFLEEMPAIAMSEGWEKITPGDGNDEGAKTVKVKNVVVLDDRRVKVTMDDDTEAVSTEAIPSPKVVRLSDVKRDKDGKYDFAGLPQEEGTLIASDVFRGMQVQSALDQAQAAGKITPAQRPTYEKLALSDLAGFQGLMAGMKVQVDLSEHGTGADGLTGLAQVQAAIDTKVAERRKANPQLAYGQALRLVASEHADLFTLKNKLQKGGR